MHLVFRKVFKYKNSRRYLVFYMYLNTVISIVATTLPTRNIRASKYMSTVKTN